MDLKLNHTSNVKRVFNIDTELFEIKMKDFTKEVRTRQKLEKVVADNIKLKPNYLTEFLPFVKKLEKATEALHKADEAYDKENPESPGYLHTPEGEAHIAEVDRLNKEFYTKYLRDEAMNVISEYNLNVRLHIGFPDSGILSAFVFGELAQEIFADNEILYFAVQLLMNRAEHRHSDDDKDGMPGGLGALLAAALMSKGGFKGGVLGKDELKDLLDKLGEDKNDDDE